MESEKGVLLVEDEFLVALDIEDRLAELGIEPIFVATNIAQAQELLTTKEIVLAILDVHVGSDLVFPVAAKAVSRNIPVIFSTSVLADEMPSEWSRYPTLSKPWNQSALMLVRQQLDNASIRA
ncbi:response regulator [Rhizobium sp. SYY.PMSO]|uniref:response regulator n=1 Tax=Rhizobium sp. SYY.PMSO TaxID=3382192 RepID=UPI000DDCF17A